MATPWLIVPAALHTKKVKDIFLSEMMALLRNCVTSGMLLKNPVLPFPSFIKLILDFG